MKPSSTTPGAAARNVWNADVELRGNIRCTGDVFFDGRLEGDLTTDGALELGENAAVRGNLTAGSVLARGKIHGNIIARERVEVRAATELVGDVRAGKLVMDEGVSFLGKAEVSPQKAPAAGAAHMPKPADAYKAMESGKPVSR